MALNKVQIARRQLGTALALYLADQDPVSVHSLACAGAEIAETLTQKAGAEPFSTHVFATQPHITAKALKEMRNRYWNAFKHATRQNGDERKDGEDIANFTDEKNDAVLFIGWHDYMNATASLPIEAQAFTAWYFALHPGSLDPTFSAEDFEEMFPGIKALARSKQKAMLRAAIEEHRSNPEIMDDPRTDPRPLVLGGL
jgi:hypothetical protein